MCWVLLVDLYPMPHMRTLHALPPRLVSSADSSTSRMIFEALTAAALVVGLALAAAWITHVMVG